MKTRQSFLPTRIFGHALVGIAILAAASAAVGAEGEGAGEHSSGMSWVPSVSVGFDIHAQSLSASFESDAVPVLERPPVPGADGQTGTADDLPFCCTPFNQPYPDPANPDAPPTPANSLSVGGETTVTPPMISFELALTGPKLNKSAWSPRPFFRFKGQLPSKGERSVERSNTPETKVNGKAEFRGSFFVGGGIDLVLPSESRRVGLRVGIDYFRIEMRPSIDVQLYETIDPGSPFFNELVFQGNAAGSGSYQGVAPSIGVDVFVGRRGQFGFSVFSAAQVLMVLGDRGSEVTVTNDIGEGQGTYLLVADRIAYQVGAGMRISWFGAKP
jgi:hypothetical protein